MLPGNEGVAVIEPQISEIIVVGGGGHARVVADALIAAGETVRGFIDQNLALAGSKQLGLPVLGDDYWLSKNFLPGHVRLANGIGMIEGSSARRRTQRDLMSKGWQFVPCIHPSVIVGGEVSLAEGINVLAGAILQTGCAIEEGAIVNSASIVEHDNHIGAYAHIAPGAVLAGDVKIGAGVHVGLGASVLQGLSIGDGAVIGAGAVVTKSTPPHTVVMGVPARQRRK